MKKKVRTSDGLNIYYQYTKRKKKASTLVFLHGVGGNWTEWKEEALIAQEFGYTTLCIDFRGHGFSSKPEETDKFTFEMFARDIRTILKKEKIKDFIFIGHSVGGSIAMAYCTMYKSLRPQALILVQAPYRYPFKKYRELNTNPIIGYTLRKLVEKGILTNKRFNKLKPLDLTKIKEENILFQIFDELYYTSIKSILYTLDASKVYAETKHEDIKQALKDITFPTLVVAGSEDKIVPINYCREVHNLVEDSVLKIFHGAAHQLPLQNPKPVYKEVATFLKSNSL